MIWKIGGIFQEHGDIAQLGQHAREIVHEPAAGDVGGGMDDPRSNGRHRRLIVLVHAQQLVPESDATFR